MKAILIDELLKEDHPQSSSTVNIDGKNYEGYNIAKPMNYDPEYLSIAERTEMAKLVMEGKAIAVQFFVDLTDEEKQEYVKAHLNEQTN